MSDPKSHADSIPNRLISLEELEVAASKTPAALPYLLATKFNYDVKQGGFAQLLYNLQGEFLANIKEMLAAANAAVALDYFVRAVKLCLENEADYFRFIESDYLSANVVKHALQLLSVEYLRQRIDFADEAANYLATCPKT